MLETDVVKALSALAQETRLKLFRLLVVAGADGNEMVIASGLQPGEEVVAAGVHVLQPGQKVTRFAGAATQ